MDILEAKLRKLTLDISPNKENVEDVKIEVKKIPFEAELKSALKELSTWDFNTNPDEAKRMRGFIADVIARFRDKSVQKDDDIQDHLSSCLIILKSIGETPLPKGQGFNGVSSADHVSGSKTDCFWTEVLLSNLLDIYDFLYTDILLFCDKQLLEACSKSYGNNIDNLSGGFAHHQLLGLLQKGIRTAIVFLKRGTLNPKTWSDNDHKLLEILDNIGYTLCNLLDHAVDVGLDIRCNIGLAMCHVLHHKFHGDKNRIIGYLETLFTATISAETECQMTKQSDDGFLNRTKLVVNKDVNRIGIAVGILSSLDVEDTTVDFSTLFLNMGENILDVDHGAKEATNLGSARVLETLTERLSNPSIPSSVLEKLSPLFGPVEFFLFSYIPGHIDAVKNCCRNMLSSLTKIYDRMTVEKLTCIGKSGDLIEELLQKVLSKDAHVKWIGLACVTKNSDKSVAVLKLDPDMPTSLLCTKRTCKNPANESYVALMSYEFKTLPLPVWETRWIAPLFLSQLSAKDESNWPQKKAIISLILKSDKTSKSMQIMLTPILRFVISKIPEQQRNSAQDGNTVEGLTETALLAAETIKVASELGLQIDLDSSDSTRNKEELYFKGLVPRSVLNSWLWNANPQIRLAGFSLLVESKKTSEIFTKQDFDSLKILLKYNLVSQNPAFRQQFMAYFKKLLTRLKDSLNLVTRKKNTQAIADYHEFFFWIWIFFTEKEGLFSGANFGRRCQSLECLSELVVVFPNFSLFGVKSDPKNVKYLEWLVDSYENNKMRVLEVLRKLPMPVFEDADSCEKILQEAMSLCESVKPPDSVTGRYLMVLLIKKSENSKYSPIEILNKLFEKLNDTLKKIRATSLTEVSCETPMYGLIRCIQMIINETEDFLITPNLYKDYSEKLINLLIQYDDILFPILGSAAPEGSLPGLPDSADDNCQVVRSITAQMLLVCSWRSMRDICLLMADMINLFPLEGEKVNIRKNPSGEFILSFEQVSKIGGHMLHLLRNLVHRGVFEQVFVGFKMLATRLWKSSNPKLNRLPGKWLDEAMDEEHMNSKCITRRSAGLPFIFQALLSAESDNEAFLHSWVQRLFIKDESSENSPLRVHAMNVLRGLFRDANFSKAMMPFVPDGLRIAFRGLKSENWTERNSGLMLYGAVIRRTFGPKLNLMSAPTFFRRFPQMYDFLLGELNVCLTIVKENSKNTRDGDGDTHGSSSISPSDFTFHLLLLLSSFAPAARVEDDHFKLVEFIPKLRQCALSSDIEVRKLAAKAIIPFLSCPSDCSIVWNMLEDIKQTDLKCVSLNYLHGSFIQIAVILRYVTKDQSVNKIVDFLSNLLVSNDHFWNLKCPTLFESIAEIILAAQDFSNPSIQKLFNRLVSTYEETFSRPSIRNRNTIPGLPIADSTISHAKVLHGFSTVKSSIEDQRKLVYNWLTQDPYNDLVENVLDYLCTAENSDVLNQIFNSDSCSHLEESIVIFDSLIKCYMFSNIKYVGQSVLELKFLDILNRINTQSYDNWSNAKDTDITLQKKLLDRVTDICVGSSATTEHKRLAIQVLCKFSFETNLNITEARKDEICKLLVDWSDSSVDDDLRFGVALSIPKIPFKNLDKFSVLGQAKIWLTILKLSQDDDPELRGIIGSKIVSPNVELTCDRRTLERLIDVYYNNFIKANPVEGLVVLFGLLFRDDFEFKTEEANDDEEGRLFDKSEMNMFWEPITFSKAIFSKLSPNSNFKHSEFFLKFQKYFSSSLDIRQVELYELASNTPLIITNPSLESIIYIIKLKMRNDNNDDNDTVVTDKLFCTPSSSLKYRVQSAIIDSVDCDFVIS